MDGENNGTPYFLMDDLGGFPKSSILIGFSIINHPFWDTPIFGNTQVKRETFLSGKVKIVGLC